MNLSETTRPLRRGLAALRRRVRSLLIVLGASRVIVLLVVALTGFFLADYFLRLPLEVRRILNLLIVAGLVVAFFRHLVRPLSARLTDQMLAAKVETAFPELENRLSSSLAFARAASDPCNEDSPELMRAVVEETAGMAGSIRFGEVARTGTTTRWAAVAAGMLIVMSVAAIARADAVSTFIQRSVLMRDIAWPRRTTLNVVDMRPGVPRRVTRGRETTIQVKAEGSVPRRVAFAFWERGARKSLERVELTPQAEDDSLFTITLPVYSSYAFTVSAGDDDRKLVYTIEALTPPAILGIEMDVIYPAYLGRGPETLSGGDQRLPQGSTVLLRIRTNMPLAEATITQGTQKATPLEARAKDVYTTKLEAERDLRYSVRLRGQNGEENDAATDTFYLRVLRDQAPQVRVHAPSPNTERLASGVVLLAFSARDDHEVRSARLRYRVNEGTQRLVELGESGGDAVRLVESRQRTPDHLPLLAAFDLARLRRDDGQPVAKGDTLVCSVEATDSAGQVQRARADIKVAIVAEDEVSQRILARQTSLRESMGRTDDHAHTAVADVEEVRAQRGRDASEFRRWSGRAQSAQARVISDLDSLARNIRSVLNLYVFNRVDQASAVDQILPYYERHLLEPDGGGMAFRGSLYRTLWAAQRERAIRARGPLAKLVEMADLSDRLAHDHAPKAYKALGRVSTRRSSDEIGRAVDEAIREQKVVGDGLARLARLMREWQSYEGIVRFFKSLRDKEKGFIEELEGISEADKSGDD